MNKNKWIEYALSQGMESVEIYQSLSTQKEITWFSGQMDTFVSSHVLGTMIRGIVDGNMASMALEDTDDDKMEERFLKKAGKYRGICYRKRSCQTKHGSDQTDLGID